MSGRAGGAVSTRLGRSPTGWLPRRFLPILMYHRIGDAARDDPGGLPSLWLTEAALRRQLAWLAAEGYRSLSLDEAHAALIAGSPPAKAVVLTFDDGYDESIARAGAALADAGLRAAVFVAAAQVGREVRVGHPTAEGWTAGRVAGRDELLGWLDAGLDVGCHSMTHADLTAATQASLVEETRDARRRLEDLLGRPVPDFCYPYTLHDAASRTAVAEAGFRMALAGEPPVPDLFAVPRMMVYPQDDERRFRRKVSGWYYWKSAWHRRLSAGPRP